MTGYTIAVTLARPFDATVGAVREALGEQGFGILTEVDLAATLKEKLGVDVPRQVVLGACRPALAHEALTVEPSIATVLPCNVVVRALDDGGHTLVEAFDPAAMQRLAGNERLRPVAEDARRRLTAALTALQPAG